MPNFACLSENVGYVRYKDTIVAEMPATGWSAWKYNNKNVILEFWNWNLE